MLFIRRLITKSFLGEKTYLQMLKNELCLSNLDIH